MPKLAIYVPKDEMRQIEKWRKRINFSQVFMRALREEIREQARPVKASGGQLDKAAQFYRRRLAENSQPLEDLGFELGSKHVVSCRLAPEAIRRLLAVEDANALSKQETAEIEKTIGGDMQSVEQTFKKLGFDEQTHPTWRRVVFRGYVKGVAKAWKQVCQRM